MREYISDDWNRFDFSITALSWVHTILEVLAQSYFPAAAFRIIRTVRMLGRLMSLINLAQADGVQIIMDTLLNSLPALIHIGLLVVLVTFIWAIVGVHLFGTVAPNGCLDEDLNFSTALQAMGTLLVLTTGEHFVCIVSACSLSPDEVNWDGTPICMESAGNCGRSHFIVEPFFVIFSLVITFTTVEMVVNVVMGKFGELTTLAGLTVNHHDTYEYRKLWAGTDVTASGHIPLSELPSFLRHLPRSMSFDYLADEEAIDPRELRLPELPHNGRFCGFLIEANNFGDLEWPPVLGMKLPYPTSKSTPEEIKAYDDYDVEFNIAETKFRADVARRAWRFAANVGQESGTVDLEDRPPVGSEGSVPQPRTRSRNRLGGEKAWMQVGFYELLYALAERKAGKAVPPGNAKCQAVRRTLGWRMPQVKSVILELEREEARALGISLPSWRHRERRQAERLLRSTTLNDVKLNAAAQTVQPTNTLARSAIGPHLDRHLEACTLANGWAVENSKWLASHLMTHMADATRQANAAAVPRNQV